MKILDKNALNDANGKINIIARIQGTLKYGFSWYPELQAQEKIIPVLDRLLDKGFMLIRNYTLPNSDIVIPMILIGPGSVSIIVASQVTGHFEAKGMEWNTLVTNGSPVPARRNLIDLTSKLTRAFQKYLDRYKIAVPMAVEPVLIVTEPGAQVEATRPAVRVVRSDAVKQFANSLLQARPVLRPDSVFTLGERIADPTSQPVQIFESPAPEEAAPPISRAQAIFKASESDQAFDPNEMGFEFKEQASAQAAQPAAKPASQAAAPKRRAGMNRGQIMLLVGMALLECCILAAGAGILFFLNQ